MRIEMVMEARVDYTLLWQHSIQMQASGMAGTIISLLADVNLFWVSVKLSPVCSCYSLHVLYEVAEVSDPR